jgi:hypothetical protein
MGWGDPFKAAWNGATGKARQLGSAVANGVNSAKDWTAERAGQVRDWGARTAGQVRDWAAETGTSAVRGIERGAIQAGEAVGGAINRGMNALRNARDSIAQTANEAYNAVRGLFGLEPVGEACPTCPGPGEPQTDEEADGYYMGEGCKPKRTLDEAKASPTRPAPDNQCCRENPSGKTIYYVNGINTTREAHCKTLRDIANSTCANVIGIYNAHEGFVADALQTGGDRQLINQAAGGTPPRLDGRNPAVNTVSDTIYSEVMAGNQPEIWAHSQGGAVTSLGLYSADNRLQMAGNQDRLSGVSTTSFGSAAPRWVDGPTYEHYVHTDDITPVGLGLGDNPSSDAARAGQGAKVYRFSGNQANGWPDQGAAGYSRGILHPTANHGVEETYVAKREQVHGGCGQSYAAQGR